MPDASLLTSLFPEEVVTRALVRDVELPDGAGTMALITLDNGRDHTRPNTFGPAGLLALREALDTVAVETGSFLTDTGSVTFAVASFSRSCWTWTSTVRV